MMHLFRGYSDVNDRRVGRNFVIAGVFLQFPKVPLVNNVYQKMLTAAVVINSDKHTAGPCHTSKCLCTVANLLFG